MTRKAIQEMFKPGQVVTVTNHYITHADHPCYGTRQRTIKRVNASSITFSESGSVPWPKSCQMGYIDGRVRLYGGGFGQKPTDLFLTIDLTQ